MIKDIIESFNKSNKFKIISHSHPIELYGGYDQQGRESILLISHLDLKEMKGTKLIDVKVIGNQDSKIVFSLINKKYKEQFYLFIDDLIECTKHDKYVIESEKKFLKRFNMWRDLFHMKKKEIMSFEKIKGLFSELLFLKKYLFSKFSISESIKSWMGPDNAKRDFEIKDIWYEIKSTTSDSKIVNISSIGQLDCEVPGELVVSRLDISNTADEKTYSLNELIDLIYDEISDPNLCDIFMAKLSDYGYIFNEKYTNYKFRFIKFEHIKIDNESNVLRMDNLPKSLVSAQYKINIDLINT